jgi:hypothetical protein
MGKLSACITHPFYEILVDNDTSLMEEAQKASWLKQLARRRPYQHEEETEFPLHERTLGTSDTTQGMVFGGNEKRLGT